MTRKEQAEAVFQKQLAEAQLNVLIARLERKDAEAGIRYAQPSHCDQCFEGCIKCQPWLYAKKP